MGPIALDFNFTNCVRVCISVYIYMCVHMYALCLTVYLTQHRKAVEAPKLKD